jgi:hypothetical protein
MTSRPLGQRPPNLLGFHWQHLQLILYYYNNCLMTFFMLHWPPAPSVNAHPTYFNLIRNTCHCIKAKCIFFVAFCNLKRVSLTPTVYPCMLGWTSSHRQTRFPKMMMFNDSNLFEIKKCNYCPVLIIVYIQHKPFSGFWINSF